MVEFSEEFTGPNLDPNKWYVLDNPTQEPALGRTKRYGQPQFLSETGGGITTTFARLKHERYSQLFPGSYFRGMEFFTLDAFPLSSTKEYQARLRLTTSSQRTGLVSGFFTYGPTQISKDDEIDFEYLGNLLAPSVSPKQFWLNTWNDTAQSPTKTNVPAGIDITQWQTYKIRWLSTRVEWQILVNGTWQIIRTESNAAYRPNEAMRVHFNIWAPHNNPADPPGNFPDAYYAGYTYTDQASQNVVHYFDVDWVKVLATSGTQPMGDDPNAATSPVALSAVTANAGSNTVRLSFTGPLDSTVAADASHYIAAINLGFASTRKVESATYEASTNTVILHFAPGSFATGQQVKASCYNLVDAKGQKMSTQHSEFEVAQ